jgi:hypothetical protein
MPDPNADLNGTYVNPNSTAWGGNAGKSPMDLYKGPTAPDEYGIPSPTDPTAWKQAVEDARATTGQAQDVNRYRGMADAAYGRGAPSLLYGNAYGYLDSANGYLDESAASRGMGVADRGSQLSALALQRQAAEGSAPSQAQLLGRNMLDQSLQAQLAGAASARGGGMAQAAAMRQAAQGAAAFQQQGTNNLAAMRAQEMATARDAYMNGATNIRGQDYIGANSATAAATAANSMAGTSADMAKTRADIELRNRALNDSAQQYYENLAFGVNQSALNANMGLAGNAQANDQFRQQMAQAEQQRTDAMMAAAMGAGSTVMAGAVTRRASGGPVTSGQPVLVGERGPEVIVPTQAGTVLPATHSASQRAAQKTMSMADVAKLRQAADEIERGLEQQKLDGPSARRLASGSPENGYTTELVPAAEQSYERWRQATSPWDTGADYDLRGAYADGMDRDPSGHLPDTYKKPNHPTFSDESKYAPYGNPGHWVGERFVPAKKVITIAPVVIGDGPERGGIPNMSYAANQVDMSVAPRERLWGGREDPYTPDPYYVPLDHAPPTWGGLLSGGREDPYTTPSMAGAASRRAA